MTDYMTRRHDTDLSAEEAVERAAKQLDDRRTVEALRGLLEERDRLQALKRRTHDLYDVAAVRRSALTPDGFKYNKWDAARTDRCYLPEQTARSDPSLVELVVWSVVWDRAGERIFAGRRLEGAGEDRLKGEWHLGWGGHVERRDENALEEWCQHAARRELHEELRTDSESPLVRVGTLYTDADDVSSDHAAIVFSVSVGTCSVAETEKYQGEWVNLSSVDDREWNAWSRIMLEHILDEDHAFSAFPEGWSA